MLAQIDTGTFQWWTQFGVLGALAFIAITAFLYYFNRNWRLSEPYKKAKLEAEVSKEIATGKLFNTLSESEPAKMELFHQQKRLLESSLAIQAAHAADCKLTREQVEEIHRRVYDIHERVIKGGQGA